MFRVLLVDDEPSVIQMLEQMIDWKSLGYTICGTASNGQDALEILKQSNPHLAIIDIRMPKINGLQLLNQASEILYLQTKFIIISAYNDFEYAKVAMRYGVSDYILKPIDDEEVVPVLKRVKKQIENEISALESQINKRKFAASNYINKLIKSENDKGFKEKCKRMLCLDDNTSFRCALLEINQFEKLMNDCEESYIHQKRLLVRKIIEDVMGRKYVFNIFDDDIHRFGMIINSTMFVEMNQCFKRISEEIKKNCNYSVSIALSEKVTGIENIGELYRQAFIALQYRIFQMDDSVLYYEQFKNVHLNYNFYESNPEALIMEIKSNNISGIKDKINNVFAEFYKRKCAPEVIENYMKNIEFEMVKHIQDHNGSVDELITRVSEISTSIGKIPVNNLKDEFYNFAIFISDYYKSISSRSSKDIIIEIKEYIFRNYQKELKLQQVAKEYFVNPVYLGQMFAKNVGMHFNEYLHNVRIEEAKKLLRRTNLKISVIASMVGYSDPEHFANKFKMITNYLPSDYRKRYNDENS